MKLHSFQHVPFEDLGSIEAWAQDRGHSVTVTRFDLGDQPPAAEDIDWLVVMGGPMNIYEEDRYPWLAAEKRAIAQAMQANKTVVGVCLGAQLIADVLGAKVVRNAYREIGWFPVTLTEAAVRSPVCVALPQTFTAFHWHGDTFELPAGATHIAASEGCRHQAFTYGERVVALQFHLESTAQSVARLIENCGDEIVPDRYVQEAGAMLAGAQRFNAINRIMEGLLDRLALQPS